MRHKPSPKVAALLMLMLAVQAQAQGTAGAGGGNPWAVFEACMACHDRETARIGPPFAAIKARYAGTEQPAELLAQRIREGSSGRWGEVPMPANSQLSPAQALAAARWILGEKAPAAAAASAP